LIRPVRRESAWHNLRAEGSLEISPTPGGSTDRIDARPEIERGAEEDDPVDEAELAAAAFLVRYRGRTLDGHRYDWRAFFQRAADDRLDILQATRPQIELYVRAMEARGLAATTIDRPQ
jgi:hypothetical protein